MAGHTMSGSVDPDNLYTKQNCIGNVYGEETCGSTLIELKVEAASERCTKGTV